MKVLVTGGCGFIGSNFIYYLSEKYPNYKIVNLDLLTYAGKLENVKDLNSNPNYKFVKGDISCREFVFDLFKKENFNVVINFAAESHVDNSIKNPSIFINTNVLGTQILLDACLEYGVNRFHQVSTDEVYGDLPLNRKDLLFTEKTPLNPSSPYSASKASADLIVKSYNRTFKLNTTISRCSNNYGPRQHEEKLIPLMINKALNNEKLPVYGTGENVRDWLHVYDHCAAIDCIVHNSKPGKIYNIGSNNEKSNLDVVKIILDSLNKDYSLIEYVKDRPGHDLRYAIDSSKIKSELNWEPIYNFDEGIKETIKWYVQEKIITK